MKSLLFIFGTRPEAIKLAPVIKAFQKEKEFSVKVCVTGQHREMLDQVLEFFSITPDYDLNLIRPNQSLFTLTANALTGLEPILNELQPDWIFVQGVTTTVLAGALAGFYKKIKIAHVEAGLRSYDSYSPFPEEMNRVLTSRMTTLHFAPTPLAVANLEKEGVSKNVYNVGNTVIDALHLGLSIVAKSEEKYAQPFEGIDMSKRTVLITCHRRESFGEPFIHICEAIQTLALNYPEVNFIYPVHLNPNIKEVAHQQLTAKNIHLLAPLDYPYLIWLMNHSYIVLTDSGGIQEEAPALGKPVLVMREVTERTEGVAAGTAKLVGTNKQHIIREVEQLLNDEQAYATMSKAVNPYGQGDSREQIVQITRNFQG